MSDRVKTMIEFALRGKKISLGESVLAHAGKVRIALLATDTGATQKKYYSDKMNSRKIPFLEYGTKSEFGQLLHKEEVSLLGIEDINLANQVIKLVKEGK